jgi:hypothetical protein
MVQRTASTLMRSTFSWLWTCTNSITARNDLTWGRDWYITICCPKLVHASNLELQYKQFELLQYSATGCTFMIRNLGPVVGSIFDQPANFLKIRSNLKISLHTSSGLHIKNLLPGSWFLSKCNIISNAKKKMKSLHLSDDHQMATKTPRLKHKEEPARSVPK